MQVILVPACGGLIVSFLNLLRTAPALQVDQDSSPPPAPAISFSLFDNVKSALRPFLKALAACVTLGTGNSLGPEGPSVEIGASIAKGVGTLFDKNPHRKLSLVAAGSAAGISSGWSLLLLICIIFIHHHANILKFVYLLPFRLWFGKFTMLWLVQMAMHEDLFY
jgi:H+/Cl- antiporter ClcA